jgi:hypothetical protein
MSMMGQSGLLKFTVLGVNMTPRERLAWLQHTNQLPVNPHTEYDGWDRSELVDEVIRLRLRVAQLEEQVFEMGWQISGESMGR